MVDSKIIHENADEWAAEMKDWAIKSNNNTGRMAACSICQDCKYKRDHDALLDALNELRKIMERMQKGILDLKKHGKSQRYPG